MNVRKYITCMSMLLLCMACDDEITGPSPGAGGDGATSLGPSYACNEQVESWLVLKGKDFSPLVVDSIADESEPSVVVPSIVLSAASDLDGQAVDAQQVTLKQTDDAETTEVRWISKSEMRIKIHPEMKLNAGVYNVVVTNANGNAYTFESALGVLGRPVVTAIEPELMCVAQGERSVVIKGTSFLQDADAVPDVMIDGKTYTAQAVEGCTDLPAAFGGAKRCTSVTISMPEAASMPGVYDVEVQNPESAACKSNIEEDKVKLTIAAPPTVSAVTPQPVCGEQLAYDITVTGEGFIEYNGMLLPSVSVGSKTYMATAVDDCEAIDSLAQVQARRCKSLTFNVVAGDLGSFVGMNEAFNAQTVRVENPQPVGCTSVEETTLTIVPPPSLDALAPTPVCLAQGSKQVTLSGGGLLDLSGEGPSVTIDGKQWAASMPQSCEDITSVTGARSCDEYTIELTQDGIAEGKHDVTLTNPEPAQCASMALEIVNVPAPTVTALANQYGCNDGRDAEVIITGTGFVKIGDQLPTVEIGGVATTTNSVGNCMAGLSANYETCTEVTVTLAADALGDGAHDVVVTNPLDTNCASSESLQLVLVGKPVVADVAPSLFCSDTGAQDVTITGTGFIRDNGTLPTVNVAGTDYTPTQINGCQADATLPAGVEVCTGLVFTLPQGQGMPGANITVVTNPAPAQCSSDDSELLVAGPPVITSTTPSQVCQGAFDGNITLEGSNFLRIGNDEPAVTVNGMSLTGTLGNCTAVQHPTLQVESCTQMALVIPAAMRNQTLNFTLDNPAPANCSSASLTLQLTPTPRVDQVTPLRICSTGGQLQLDGEFFEQGMVVTLANTPATMVTVAADGKSAIATFGQLPMMDLATLSVENPSGCGMDYPSDVRISNGPRVFYIDPPVVYDGISTQVTMYVSGLFGGQVTEVIAEDSAGNRSTLPITFDPNKPNTVQAVIPKNILPQATMVDTLDFYVTDDINCTGVGNDLVTVTKELKVSVESIQPPFGWSSENTGVLVTSAQMPPAGFEQFAATPRVYLNPVNAQQGTVATEVRSVLFNNPTELSGIVPLGLPIGKYDVIVLNPNGGVGLLPAAFDVTENAPPIIDTVSPGSWQTNQAALAVNIAGSNFADPTVEAFCQDPGGTIDVPVITRTSFTSSDIDVNVDTTNLDHLSVCYIRVTNASDGSFVEYSPITVTNPAGNFVSFKPGPDMLEARRGHAMAQGAPSRTARFIYALGGDDGTTAGAKVTTEAAAVNRFGEPVSWFALPNDLPAGRTFAAATTVDDFIYLSGGHDGTAVTDTVWRANILDPLFAPRVTDVDFFINGDFFGGIPTGVYYYRVAAVMEPNDPANPGGEGLASEPQAIRIPVNGISIVLTWSAIPGATSYRIYRSAMPDQVYGNEVLIGTVNSPTLSFVDDGSLMPGTEKPLPLGSLGKWHEVAKLDGPRYRHGFQVLPSPTTQGQYHFYSVGGSNGTTALATYAMNNMQVVGPRVQNVTSAAIAGAISLGVARFDAALLAGTVDNANLLSMPTLYMLGGATNNGTTRQIEYAQQNADGTLNSWVVTSNMQRSRAGYAAAVANNNLVVAGGQNATSNATADKGEICAPNATCTQPALDRWNSLSNVNMQDRYLHGYISATGFLYMAGGLDGALMPTRTVDYSPLGGTP